MKTILLVDDEYAMVEALSALLEDEGYRVTTAANGEEALAMLGADPLPDLVLLDVMMPRLDGREVLKRMRSDVRTRSVPVIVVSAAFSAMDRQRLDDAQFLQKPFDIGALLRAIHATIGAP